MIYNKRLVIFGMYFEISAFSEVLKKAFIVCKKLHPSVPTHGLLTIPEQSIVRIEMHRSTFLSQVTSFISAL